MVLGPPLQESRPLVCLRRYKVYLHSIPKTINISQVLKSKKDHLLKKKISFLKETITIIISNYLFICSSYRPGLWPSTLEASLQNVF